MKIRVFIFTLACALLVAGCGGGEDQPIASVEEVKVAYDAAPELLARAVGRTDHAVFTETFNWNESRHTYMYRVMIDYAGQRIYDETKFAIYPYHGTAPSGDHVIVVNEYAAFFGDPPTTAVFVNGSKVPAIQSLPRIICGQTVGIPIRDIRAWRDGWLIVFARASGNGWNIDRWALYRPATGEFVDYGEYGSYYPRTC